MKEFVFEDGTLKAVIDHSESVQEIREKLKERTDFPKRSEEDVKAFVESCFDLSYEEKAWWIK